MTHIEKGGCPMTLRGKKYVHIKIYSFLLAILTGYNS
jgi:hypothetical protein